MVKELLAYAEDVYTATPISAADLYQMQASDVQVLSTGCQGLDDLFLEGGMRTGTLIELVGPAASGKTQLCLSTCVHCVVRSSFTVAFIDTNSSFSSKRIQELYITAAKTSKTNSTASLEERFCDSMKRIRCFKPGDAFKLLSTLEHIHEQLTTPTFEDNYFSNLRLIIIDSLASVISTLLSMQTAGHSIMVSLARMLKVLATEQNILILYTNFTVSADKETVSKPALGETWSYVPDFQLSLEEMRGVHLPPLSKTYLARLSKSNNGSVGKRFCYKIGQEGILAALSTLADDEGHAEHENI